MPNNQFRAFRSGSNTFSQRTYKHQVHPKRRVVFQRNQQSGFKNKIQIKGQIPKALHGPNSFIFKRLEENNSKQISFRHCKRSQHSFHSETNPNLPPANPVNGSHRGFTDQLRNLPPVREGSDRRGGYVSASLLKQPFPCRQTFRGEKASNKSPTFKQIRSESKIQDGKHFTSTRHFETKQFPHQNRLKRCFLQHPYRQKVKKIPSVYLPQQALPILRPTIQNFNSSSSVFQDFKACYCSSPHKRYISHHLSRRSTHCRRDIHRLSEPYKTSNFSSGIPGFSNQLRKIRNNPSPKARILGLHNRFNLYDSCPPSRENSVDRIVSPKAKKRYHINKTALKIHSLLHFNKICCLPSNSTLSITSVSKKPCFKGSPILPQSVQSKGSPEPRSNNRPKVVGRPPAVSQQKTNSYKRPRSHHHIGCLRSELASMVREKIGSRPMRRGNVLAYKPKRTSSCIFGSKNIRPISNKSVVPHSTSNRQSGSRFIYKSSGGNTLKTSLPIKSGSVELVTTETDLYLCKVYPRYIQQTCRSYVKTVKANCRM